jgi:FKBP-type peptidyl-prolyl cis-trans isomerase
MRKTLLASTGLGLGLALFAFAQTPSATPTTAPAGDAAPTTAPSTQSIMEKVSYGYGMSVGTDLARLKEFEMAVDLDAFQAGLQDALASKDPKYAREDLMAAYQEFESTMRERAEVRQKALTEKATAEGKAFLDANKAKPGVQTTASGLQYQILEEGKGEQPKATDTVKVNYTGTLIDGKKFDASADHGGPVEFPLNRVIKGWGEGFQLLKVGSKAKLFIPAELAYGEQSPDPTIPPNSTLIFEVELVEIVPPAAQPAPATGPTQMP